MDIKVLSYIDQETVKTFSTDKSVSTDNTQSSGATDASFQSTLATAQRTMEALTVDLITTQDTETIQKAAVILSNSNVAQLQKLGQTLITLEDAASTDTSEETTADTSTVPTTGTESSAANTQAASESTANAASESADTSENTTASASDAAAKASSVLACPSSLEDYFTEAAEKYDVDIALLEAIAKAESNFNASAKSSAGAIGVMQLMPSTASSLGVSDSYDAKSNIMGGAKLIAQLLDKYDGDISLALAAYNAGSGNVAKYGGIPPFTETQNYVKKVTEYYKQAIA